MSRPSRLRYSRNLVAVAWDHDELLTVVARRLRGGFELLDAFSIPLIGEATLASASQQLADELQRRRVGPYELLLGAPRSQVELITLELPPAKPDELPVLVRNEVTLQLSDLPDDVVVDYRVLGTQPTGGVKVEVGALRPETRATLNTISEALKHTPAQIVIRSLAVASLFRRQVKNLPEASLLLNLMHSNADLSVLDGAQITFTRSVHLATDENGAQDVGHLSDEIRRTLFVAPRSAGQDDSQDEIQHVYMFADLERNSPFVEALADDLQLTVSVLDPLAGIELRRGQRPERTHRFAALIGMLWDFLDHAAPLDFANPKQAPPPPRWGKKIAVYSVLGTAALAAIAWTLTRDVVELTQVARDRAAEVAAQQQLRKKLRSKTVVLDAVERWEASEINWLDELRRLSEQFPSADEAVVQRITMAPSAGSRGLISMSVRVRDPEIIADLETSLRDATHQVSSQRISQSGDEQSFSVQFETSVLVTPTGGTAEPPTGPDPQATRRAPTGRR